MHIFHAVIYKIILVLKGRNFFNDQELLKLVIIVVILMTFMFDSGVILSGEIRCLSPSAVKA